MSAAVVSLKPSAHGEAIVDRHTPLHFLVGFVAGAAGIDPHTAMIVFVGAKMVDQALQHGTSHAIFGKESGQSLGNEMADILVEIAGLHYGKSVRQRLAEPQLAPPAVAPAAGLGAYYQDPVVQPIHGLGYVRFR